MSGLLGEDGIVRLDTLIGAVELAIGAKAIVLFRVVFVEIGRFGTFRS
jgi:hypothetical protein